MAWPRTCPLTYERRREILMAKLRGQGTTTRKMIEDTAAAFSGGEVKVIEDNPVIFLLSVYRHQGIPRNMQAFVSMLEDIKPAHLSYRFEYRYTTWNEHETIHMEPSWGMDWMT